MAIKKILPEDFELFTLQTNPSRTYTSSSTDGVTGKINLFARRSLRIKEVQPLSFFSGSRFLDQDLNKNLVLARSSSGNCYSAINQYMTGANQQQSSLRTQQQLDIVRFTPGVSFGKNFLTKGVVTNNLMPYYRTSYPSAHFGYTNFHSLNFFSTTNNSIPSSSVLLYPNPVTTTVSGAITGRYIPPGAFTFDFWINPRYSTLVDTESFKAGTLFHLSSCFALSMVTGSSKDTRGLPDKFKLILQLSSSADLLPSTLPSSLPQLVFSSSDNSLSKNTWNHVSVRWGTSLYNLGSGSFVINNKEMGTFNIPSSSIIPTSGSFLGKDNPTVLCVGNYYEGNNAGANVMAQFFTTETATREGLEELIAGSGNIPQGVFNFTHPLQAEVHDLKIYNRYLTDPEIKQLSTDGPTSTDNLLFYLPPFFTKESPTRKFHLGRGGILLSPFLEEDGTTETPFSAEMSFGLGGHYLNLENYTREFVAGKYPRLFALSMSAQTTTSQVAQTCDQLLYATGSVKRRAYTILPCDNGTFYPNFKTFLDPLDTTGFINDLGNKEPGTVSLRELIPTSSILTGLGTKVTGSLLDHLVGPSPEAILNTSTIGTTFAVLQRTRDNSSNQVVFFDISNLYYGDNIKPGTVVLSDSALSGSDSKVRMTLKDDGHGNLYRADTTGSHATWNSVGNVFYNEGIILLKNPSLFFLGENQFSLQFAGERNIHVQKFNLVARPYEHVSSSNPSYIPVSASNMVNDTDQQFVYVSGINLMDDNLNIISKTTLSQPLVLRSSDQMKFVVKMDY